MVTITPTAPIQTPTPAITTTAKTNLKTPSQTTGSETFKAAEATSSLNPLSSSITIAQSNSIEGSEASNPQLDILRRNEALKGISDDKLMTFAGSFSQIETVGNVVIDLEKATLSNNTLPQNAPTGSVSIDVPFESIYNSNVKGNIRRQLVVDPNSRRWSLNLFIQRPDKYNNEWQKIEAPEQFNEMLGNPATPDNVPPSPPLDINIDTDNIS